MNNIEDILQYADNLICETTSENLTPVEEAILKGVWEGQKYWQIAVGFNNCSESHIKKEAAKLWKKLGQSLGEDLNKDNFRSRVEKKYRVSQRDNFGVQVNGEGNINICDKSSPIVNNKKEHFKPPKPKHQIPIIDLTKAPELNYNYGRNSEIATLKEWILENKTRLITIYGLIGIGKTALTLKLISEIETEFDYIIYRSLDNFPQLITLKDELKQFFSQSQNPLPEIIDYFNSSRCLVIIDDVDNIFQFGNLAGQYLTEYKDYSKFFHKVATSSHQSCLILISSAKPPDIEILEIQNKYTKTLYLQGLEEDAKAIFRDKGLKDEDKWDELITLYQGHPGWLNIIILTIIEFFNGKVSLFLTDNDDLFLGDIEALLKNHLERLSELENKVINWLATQNEPIDIFQKPADIEVSNARFLQIIQSLTRRCLVEKVLGKEEVKFQLNSLFKTYMNNEYCD
ncbi:ATP-binding protein [Aphanizomenon flos-aquae NRERC-008]|jgi:glutaredoxin-related protein|uniref:ATP-binding protein n=1 Tax=Aphanizomenon flos-aquae FACHB-1249 TaxID=2692889 RepID=A0ABR8IXP2_APHFL|nr:MULTISPECIES: ATP-binding protein [Aphanizomenon]MBD2392544.1 ATP-binding protein [Aphanizomenon flos-aquae FACHB-1171]MBD2558819.1 ATP-binding protein [Aphanizomenon flos-aquae FACHB-1290]MBD2630352.1 ATP-binding protein [Aphanizomenon sp. FACHB-1399]MBD2641144.1 ATP-binding protein [Aphanizomenon sp. FACHB-1401]MBD2659225.1 ATP-binding protein [Aphanizomenon flos-aquae FACHB-1265]